MIKIQINKTNNKYSSLIVSGHSNYDEHGKDIVCAGVSAVVTGGLNALANENKKIISDKPLQNYAIQFVENFYHTENLFNIYKITLS